MYVLRKKLSLQLNNWGNTSISQIRMVWENQKGLCLAGINLIFKDLLRIVWVKSSPSLLPVSEDEQATDAAPSWGAEAHKDLRSRYAAEPGQAPAAPGPSSAGDPSPCCILPTGMGCWCDQEHTPEAPFKASFSIVDCILINFKTLFSVGEQEL